MTPNNLRHIVETCLKASGLDDRRRQGAMIHAFRHTYGSVMAASGIRVESLRKLMGHDSISTTQGYIDTLARDERESAAKNTVYAALKNLNIVKPEDR